jgi:FtsP/CotA-like multicopper oxidase with cupredoxin domain
MTTRREFLGAALATGAAALGSSEAASAGKTERLDRSSMRERPLPPGIPGRDYTPVITPNSASLPWKIVDGAKVYHLIAQEMEHEFAPGLKARCWGFNGRVHGPTIEAVEGDWVRIYVTNELPTATSIHWHGVLLPNGMDGVGGLTQKAISPGETYLYEFPIRQHGTHMYHSHHDEMIQMAMGLMGLMVLHPRQPKRRIDRDFAILLS